MLPVTSGREYESGEYIDEWGCRFVNVQSGIIGVVRQPRLADWSALEGFHPPPETLTVDVEAVNAFCRGEKRFVLAGCCPRPFERLQFLRSTEAAMLDLVTQPPELEALLKLIHDHYCREVEIWSRTDVNGISFMDDWGAQTGPLTSPALFRRYFLPMYRDYANIARSRGKYVFMHSDGHIAAFLQDLLDAGVQALNSQLFCMDIPAIGETCRGRLTFWGEIDRQNLLPRGSTEDIREAVRKVHRHLWADGGCIAQCEFGPGAKPENVWTVFDEWDRVTSKK